MSTYIKQLYCYSAFDSKSWARWRQFFQYSSASHWSILHINTYYYIYWYSNSIHRFKKGLNMSHRVVRAKPSVYQNHTKVNLELCWKDFFKGPKIIQLYNFTILLASTLCWINANRTPPRHLLLAHVSSASKRSGSKNRRNIGVTWKLPPLTSKFATKDQLLLATPRSHYTGNFSDGETQISLNGFSPVDLEIQTVIDTTAPKSGTTHAGRATIANAFMLHQSGHEWRFPLVWARPWMNIYHGATPCAVPLLAVTTCLIFFRDFCWNQDAAKFQYIYIYTGNMTEHSV